MTNTNPFCPSLPTQLRAWDSTAMRAFQECPRKYELSIVNGWRPNGSSVHLDFGSYYHECVELFDRERALGADKEAATLSAIDKALHLTWHEAGPWGGTYVAGWRCNNWTPASGPGKRSRYNCEASRQWWGGHRSAPCPKCAHTVTNRWVYAPENTKKNRHTLFASVLEYCDSQPTSGGVQPITFPNGQIALEMRFELPLPYNTPDGDPYLLCGHLDGMVSVAGEHAVRERKTTGASLGPRFFDRYAPDIQIDNYDLAADMLYGDTLHPTAVMAEVMQIAVDFSKLQRGFVTVPAGRREEHLRDIGYWLKAAEQCAEQGYYPKNASACNNAGGCQFRRVCKEEPGDVREAILQEYYHQDSWSQHILVDRN